MNIEFIVNKIKSYSDAIAVVSDGKEYTFNNIIEEFNNAKAYLEKNDVKPNSVVSLLSEFNPKSIAMFLALIEIDAIIVPISKTVKATDSYVKVSQSEYFIDIQEDYSIKFLESTPSHEMLLGLKEKKAPGLILFSSGTTGEPKAALHDLTFLLDKFRVEGKRLSTVTFLLFDHIGGFNTMMHTLVNGGLSVTLKTRSADEVCSLIEKYKLQLLPTSPTFINLIILNKTYEKYDLSSLEIITYGTEPMPEATLKAMHKILPNAKLKQTYGLSEVGIMPTKSENSESLWVKLRNDETFQTKIVDDILYIKSKSAMIGYLNAPSPFDEDGWFNTKDKVLQKGDYVKILGRTTDLINVGGQKVYPIEVESTFLECDGVLDIRVYGSDNPIMGKVVEAEVFVAPENNNRDFIKQLRKYAKERLESFKIPVKFNLTDEKLYGDRFKKRR